MKKLTILLLSFFFPLVVHAQTTPTIEIFVREGCVHCAKVEAFIQKYELEDKVVIKETYKNDENTKELNDWYEKFQINENSRGVPFMVVDGKTNYMGDTPIIDYLTTTFNITVDPTDNTYNTSTSDILFIGIGGLLIFSVLGYGIYSIVKKK